MLSWHFQIRENSVVNYFLMFFLAAESHGNDPEADYNKVVSLPPQEICIGTGNISVTQIACGQHHTGKHRLCFHSFAFQ